MEIEPRIPGRLHGRPATFQSWSSWKDAWCCYFVIYLISNPICFCKWLRYILEHISIEYLNDGAHYYSFFFQIKAGQQKLKMIASSSWTKIWDERKTISIAQQTVWRELVIGSFVWMRRQQTWWTHGLSPRMMNSHMRSMRYCER